MNQTSWINAEERHQALMGLVSNTQSKGSIHKSSSLLKLTPFLDKDGLLRAGGRLNNARMTFDEMYALIIPKKSKLTKLLLDYYHSYTLHGGVQLMLSTIRRRYLVVGGRSPVRTLVSKCTICIRHRGEAAKQLMGQLSTSRVQKIRPILYTGVDYAGPFELKTWSGKCNRTYKAYLVVFVCMSSSAVYLELATDYTTEGFLAAFRRFVSRRGSCAKLFSDCGTNWDRWSKEYLQKFHVRTEWMQSTPSVKVGTMALVIDERLPPGKWPLGRVIKIFPGRDGLVQAVTIKT